VCGIEYPEDIINEDEENWLLDNNCNFNMKENREKTMALTRIIGYLLADGCIYLNRARIVAEAYFGTLFDSNQFVEDLKLLGYLNVSINKRIPPKDSEREIKGTTFRVRLPSNLSKIIGNIKGMIIGKRANQDMQLPHFVLNNDCPLAIIKEFLGGLFGGDGTAPYLCANNTFGNISFKWTTIEYNKESMYNVFCQLKLLIEKFGIQVNEITYNKVIYYENSIKPFDYLENPRWDYYFSICIDDTNTFLYNIGYRYCVNKAYRLTIAASYFKMCNKIRQQHSKVLKRTNELIQEKIPNVFARNNKYSFNDCLEQAREEVFKNEPVLNEYSYSSVKDIGYQRGEAKRHFDKKRKNV
jgi:hypothetical protein